MRLSITRNITCQQRTLTTSNPLPKTFQNQHLKKSSSPIGVPTIIFSKSTQNTLNITSYHNSKSNPKRLYTNNSSKLSIIPSLNQHQHQIKSKHNQSLGQSSTFDSTSFIINQTLNPTQSRILHRSHKEELPFSFNQGQNQSNIAFNKFIQTSLQKSPPHNHHNHHTHTHSHTHLTSDHVSTRQKLFQSITQSLLALTRRNNKSQQQQHSPHNNYINKTQMNSTHSPQDEKDRLYFTHKRDVDDIITKLNYNIKFPPQFQANFLRLGADSSTRDFIVESVRKFNRCFCINWGISLLRTSLAWCMNHTDIIGFLKVGLMHIISAKQLQLLLQHSYTVDKPLNSEEFKKFDFTKWLQAQKQTNTQQLIDSIAKPAVGSSDGHIRPNNRQHGNKGPFHDNDDEKALINSPPKLQKKSSSSSAHRSKTLLAGSLLGVQVESDEDEEDDGHIRSDDNSYELHKLNLDHIFGLNGTTADNLLNPSSGQLKFNRLNNNNLNNNDNDIEKGSDGYQTYQSVLFGPSGLNNCPDYLQDENLLQVKYGRMLDVGAGSGRMAELLSPVFDKIECTEVSEQMVKSIRSKGFVAHYVDNLDQMGQKDKYDVVCLFNLIDRCEEPISLLHQLHQRLKPQLQQHRDGLIAAAKNCGPFATSSTKLTSSSISATSLESNAISRDNIQSEPYNNLNGRVVIAVPLPLRPSVEMTLDNSTTTWRDPKENIAMSKCWCCTSFEESLQHLVMNIIEPCGYDVLTVSRLPYLSEGNMHHSYFVLEDVVLICAPKPEWTP